MIVVSETLFVTLSSNDPEISVSAMLGDGSPTFSGGAGVWAEETRPNIKSVTDFVGVTATQLAFSVVFDGLATGSSVEADIERLTSLQQVASGYAQPPIVDLDGYALPPFALDLEWVVGSIDWGPAERNEVGERMRQVAVITLIEFVEADILVELKPPVGVAYRLYKVRRGDTFPKIAVRVLKNRRRWRQIARMNGKSGPVIPRSWVGRFIKVPRR